MKAVTLLICTNRRLSGLKASCGERGATALLTAMKPLAQQAGLQTSAFPCMGACEQGPNVRIAPGGPLFQGVSIDQIPAIIDAAREFQQTLLQNP